MPALARASTPPESISVQFPGCRPEQHPTLGSIVASAGEWEDRVHDALRAVISVSALKYLHRRRGEMPVSEVDLQVQFSGPLVVALQPEDTAFPAAVSTGYVYCYGFGQIQEFCIECSLSRVVSGPDGRPAAVEFVVASVEEC